MSIICRVARHVSTSLWRRQPCLHFRTPVTAFCQNALQPNSKKYFSSGGSFTVTSDELEGNLDDLVVVDVRELWELEVRFVS